MRNNTSLLRSIVPALVAAVIYVAIVYACSALIADPAQSWVGVVVLCIWITVAVVLGVIGRSISAALLNSSLFSFTAMLLLHLTSWATGTGSFRDMLFLGLIYALMFSIAGILLGALGYLMKRPFRASNPKNERAS